ncbi:variant erythrocyte surface antigen-1 family protein [Babesia divergens]|uniref:Variant erythrocyte surface antigen-1 family protein n=1 Tax=Babesia divergens TaxID=32595 RepID=A0AAD9GIK5_BABDI|nr:variant erythrocyte surface antigen-1 family protein [Babesia divergens]
MVCCMYYTDVFVGSNNINNLKSALNAELNGFNNSSDLTQLVHGLCLFMGYPSCLCKPKKSVGESLERISKELKEELKNYKCLNSKPLNLNCSCNSKEILCKCCVIRCIKELRDKSNCNCVKNPSQSCQCQGTNGKCCKDFLSGLEACLSLLNLKTDLKDCNCDPNTCCNNGKCNSGCNLCDPSKSTITGLGLSRPNPVRLAKRLNEMLCGTQKSGQCPCGCGCNSGTKNTSCCCFCHSDCKTKGLSALCSKSCPGCSCAQASGECGLQKFCKSINTIKVLVGSKEMTCCEGGKNCHCALDSGSKCSGSNCCVVSCSTNGHYQHSVKCMILRVVKFFNGLKPESLSSPSKCSKLCCELICVGKYCDFLKTFYDKGDQKSCGKCTKKGTQNCNGSTLTPASSTSCCNGEFSKCASTSDCCQGCQECDAIKFRKALETLRYSTPCGHDLWRVLNDFIHFIRNVFMPNHYFIRDTVLAAVKGCSNCNKSGTDSRNWKPCTCSSSSCSACPKLLGNSKLMSILLSQYFSSYDSSSANWDSLCSKSVSKCCGSSSCTCPSSCSSNPSSCDPKDCCENCPKRLCAKIFLGMLPCLYYGLKIVFDRCKYGSDFPDWSLQNISQGSIGKFLTSWGFTSSNLSSKNASGLPPVLDILYGSGKFKSLFDLVSKKYFSKHVSDPSKSKPPQTVRSMLIWLYGLRFQKHFSDLVENCKSLCLPFGNSFHPDAFCYYIYTCSFILPVSVISTIETSDSAQNVFSSSSEFSKFLYPSDPSKLFEAFCEYVRKIFVALNFLSIQCRLDRDSAGWKDCYFGSQCAVDPLSSSTSVSSASSCCPTSLPKGILCASIPGISNCHEHCTSSNPLVKCLGSNGQCKDSGNGSDPTDAHTNGKCIASCPHPLQRFLTHGSESFPQSQSKDYPFALPGIVPMGFDQEKLPKKARWGQDLYHDIEPFCKDGFYPLTRLVQFILCVSQRPPESFLDLYAFFKKFVEALNSKPDLSSTFVQWIDGEPGRYPGRFFAATVQAFYGAKDSHSGSSHSPANLFSLSGCHANRASGATCGPYLHPLTEYSSGVFTPELCSMYLSWICYRAEKFYSEFKRFHKEAQEKFSCCLKSSGSSCPKIVECPCALPFIYSQGFTFLSPGGLNCVNSSGTEHVKHGGTRSDENDPKCTRRTCSQFLKQLDRVVNGQPFKDLLKVIDNFLWHIRLPFVYAFLYIWIIVISYFYYVQFYKLDLLHIDSHLHLPRSFKILPSTLFSDASSKLKDLSYFTL